MYKVLNCWGFLGVEAVGNSQSTIFVKLCVLCVCAQVRRLKSTNSLCINESLRPRENQKVTQESCHFKSYTSCYQHAGVNLKSKIALSFSFLRSNHPFKFVLRSQHQIGYLPKYSLTTFCQSGKVRSLLNVFKSISRTSAKACQFENTEIVDIISDKVTSFNLRL